MKYLNGSCLSVPLMAAALTAFFILSLPEDLLAHGVAWEISQKKSYGFEFSYDDDTPMGFAEVKVFGPDDPAKLSQTGRTDKNGWYAFIPDGDGQWLVTADDGAGHLAKAELSVSRQPSARPEGAEASNAVSMINVDREISKATKPLKIGLVVSIFLNFAFVAMISKRKKAA